MYTDRFTRALALAHQWHQSQYRKGADPPIPYISHLLTVAGIVIEHGGTEDEAIAALLHDSIEDAGQTVESLTAEFSATVAAIVAACTDDVPGIDRGSVGGWRIRKEGYIAHLTENHLTSAALLVSCADKLANARSILADLEAIGPAVFERFKGGADGTLWYYRALADRFNTLSGGALGVGRPRLVALTRQYERVVTEMEYKAREGAEV